MANSTDRPWRAPVHGVSRLGLVLLLIGLTTFGYGIVQRGLPSTSADRTAAEIYEKTFALERQLAAETDPNVRERLDRQLDEWSRAGDRSLSSSRDLEAQHAAIAILGVVLSLAGIAALMLHRRRTRNLL